MNANATEFSLPWLKSMSCCDESGPEIYGCLINPWSQLTNDINRQSFRVLRLLL